MKRTVCIAELVDDVVRYRVIDDCYVCPYDTGSEFAKHNCRLTDEYLHPDGRVDIDVPETCPFPAKADGNNTTEIGIIDRYSGISRKQLAEIVSHIESDSFTTE